MVVADEEVDLAEFGRIEVFLLVCLSRRDLLKNRRLSSLGRDSTNTQRETRSPTPVASTVGTEVISAPGAKVAMRTRAVRPPSVVARALWIRLRTSLATRRSYAVGRTQAGPLPG